MGTPEKREIQGWLNCPDDGAELIDSYALVTYIPEPLGPFLDELRLKIVPTCIPRAHVTVLPPRPLSIPPEQAWEQVRAKVGGWPPFVIEATRVEKFRETSVIYLEIGKGRQELLELHAALNSGGLGYAEPWEYHPHITLAQDLPAELIEEAFQIATREWAGCRCQRWFTAEVLTFVQNTTRNRWLDLAEYTLAPNRVPVAGGR